MARCGMSYRISLHRLTDIQIDSGSAMAGEPRMGIQKMDQEIFARVYEELDEDDMIARINHKPRARKAKKGAHANKNV
jgi:hypothetical protein